jgi:hypothetical protein
MNKPYFYEIRIEGLIPDHWSDWFEGLTIDNDSTNETTLKGMLADQAALLGVLTRIHGLNWTLISVNRKP